MCIGYADMASGSSCFTSAVAYRDALRIGSLHRSFVCIGSPKACVDGK